MPILPEPHGYFFMVSLKPGAALAMHSSLVLWASECPKKANKTLQGLPLMTKVCPSFWCNSIMAAKRSILHEKKENYVAYDPSFTKGLLTRGSHYGKLQG